MNKDIHILFGLRIKELRVRAHISQEELSFRSGLSKNYISDVERGTRNISLKAISKEIAEKKAAYQSGQAYRNGSDDVIDVNYVEKDENE